MLGNCDSVTPGDGWDAGVCKFVHRGRRPVDRCEGLFPCVTQISIMDRDSVVEHPARHRDHLQTPMRSHDWRSPP